MALQTTFYPDELNLMSKALAAHAAAHGIPHGSQEEGRAALDVLAAFQLGWRNVDEIVAVLEMSGNRLIRLR